MFSYTEALPLLMQLIVNWPQRVLAKELGALAVNVSHNSRNAENMCQVCEKYFFVKKKLICFGHTKNKKYFYDPHILYILFFLFFLFSVFLSLSLFLFCKDGGLKRLLHRSAKNRDAVLMKVVRNISQMTYNKSVPEEEEDDANGGSGGGSEQAGQKNGGSSKEEDAGGKRNETSGSGGGGRSSGRGSSRSSGRGKNKERRSVWQPFVRDLFKLCKACADEDENMFVEVLGTLGNMTRFDLPERTTFSDMIERYDMIDFLSRQLLPGKFLCSLCSLYIDYFKYFNVLIFE